MQTDELVKIVTDELNFRKGENISVIDVQGRTSVTDFMIIATATSIRHASSLAHYVAEKLKEFNIRPLGQEGEQGSEWVLLDLNDVIVHIMTAQTRDLYQLEKLWSHATRAQEVEKSS
jgi:ribosome-associated protein